MYRKNKIRGLHLVWLKLKYEINSDDRKLNLHKGVLMWKNKKGRKKLQKLEIM